MEKLHDHCCIQDDKTGRVTPPGMSVTPVIPEGEAIDPSGPMPC
jgi:hypothetical protein